MRDLQNFLTEEEWEMLCDGCGLCCLYKLEDQDSGELLYTRVICPLLNRETARCTSYSSRFEKMPTCTKISPESLPQIARWLPKSCAYRCLYEGVSLPDWHPIYSDESSEAAALREKIAGICIRPNSFITKKTAEKLIRESIPPKNKHKLTRFLLANVIEDIDI